MRRLGRCFFMAAALAGVFVWAACGDEATVAPSALDAGQDQETRADATPVIEEPQDTGAPDVKRDVNAKPPFYHDAGPENVILDGGDVDGGILCTADGKLEEEPNDTRETATPIKGTRCGVIRLLPKTAPTDGGADAGKDGGGGADAGGTKDGGAKDGGATDAGASDGGDAGAPAPAPTTESDFFTFKVSAAAQNIYVEYRGNVKVLVQADKGAQLDISNPAVPVTLPFVPDTPYYIEVRSADGEPQAYRITVFEQFPQ